MDRHQFDAEDREQQIVAETRRQYSALSRAVLASDQAATKRVTEALCDYIADDNAAAQLVRATLLDSQSALAVLTDLMWTQAGELAEAEVKRKEQRRHESAGDNRIAIAECDRLLARVMP